MLPTWCLIIVSLVNLTSSVSGSCRILHNTGAYTGGPRYDIGGGPTKNVANPLACMKKCTKTSRCKNWAYSYKSKDCWLKSRSYTSTYRSIDWAMGLKRCTDSCNIEKWTDYDTGGPRYDIQPIVKANSARQCQTQCTHTNLCKVWSWSLSTKKCYRKKQWFIKKITNGGVHSGPKKCTENACLHEVGIDYDTGGPSHDIAHPIWGKNNRITTTPYECQQMCAANAKCVSWSWLHSKGKCWLKDVLPYSRIFKEGVTSGPKLCVK